MRVRTPVKIAILCAVLGYFILSPFTMYMSHHEHENIAEHEMSLWNVFGLEFILWSLTFTVFSGVCGFGIGLLYQKIVEKTEALKESEERFRELFENSMDVTYILDTEGKFTSVNRAMEEMTGYKEDELLGKEKLDIVADDSKEDVSKHFAHIMKGKEPLPIEFQMVHKGGHPIDVEVRSSPILEGDNIAGMQESARDITFRMALEKELKALNNELAHYSRQLKKSNQLKGLFTDILRHDLLNPAGVIRNLAEIMEGDKNLKDSEELAMIKRNIMKLEGIINNASQYAKLESAEKLEMDELDLAELINNIISDFGIYIEEKGMNVEFKPKGKHMVKANNAIESVFVNILSNAIKYSPEGTDIKITIEDNGDSKKISFAEQGEGIADEHKEAVFDRFTRKDKAGVKGSGLGLAIVKRVVEMHGGRVWVEDNTIEYCDEQGLTQTKKQGSIFYVQLPKGEVNK